MPETKFRGMAQPIMDAVFGSPPEQEPEPPPAPQTPFEYGPVPPGHVGVWISVPAVDREKSWKAEWIGSGPEAAPESPPERRIWMPYIR